MLDINWADVKNVFDLTIPYLISFGVVLLIAIAVMIFAKRFSTSMKFMVRRQSIVAILIALAIVINLIAFYPLNTVLTLASGRGTISEASSERAEQLGERIAEEGIVLLENDQDLLPLANGSQINVFGWASTNPIYGGTGSGSLSDTHHTISLIEGLSNAGFVVNDELIDFYTTYRDERPVLGLLEQDWTLPEPPVNDYSDELLENAEEFSDTAVIVISRSGGEGADLPTNLSDVTYNNNSDNYNDFEEGAHYLELHETERQMIDMVTSTFDNVVLIYNGSNVFELEFVEDYDQIKSVLWVPAAGQTGFNALGEILSGAINPSGKTADIFPRDLTAIPAYNNFGDFEYTNMDEYKIDHYIPGVGGVPTFVNYVEGIYVGYRFYETAAAEGLIDYDEHVLYPFGYGLSYTSFDHEISDWSESDDGTISVDVTVTNTGDTKGKDVVELYFTPPYINGGIEKSDVNLVAFEKTKTLEAGESQTLTLSFTKEDLASYDSENEEAYVLDAGDYILSIRSDSHTVLDEVSFSLDETIVYNQRSSDNIPATNQFDFAEGDVTYLSRENGFENYEEATKAPENFEMSEENLALFRNELNFDATEFFDESAEMPITGAKNGVDLVDMRGLDYDDQAWETLLDQLLIDDMVNLIAYGGYQTSAAKSVGKIATIDLDGPASINNNFTGVGSVGFPSAVMMANTWNVELAHAFGNSIGEMAVEMGVSGWYAPAMNIHRTAFAGRNFEYYSEDGILSGEMAAHAVKGAADHGVYSYLKHFAMNDQETNRLRMLATWSNEQAIREIYLKPFEVAVKDGGAQAIMSAFNYIGPVWAGASSPLLNTVLREEWGFQGMVLTDYFGGYGYMDANWMVPNGGDIALATYDVGVNMMENTDNPSVVKDMRQASKNILYTTVNSNAYSAESLNAGMPSWQIVTITIDIVIFGAIILLEVLIFRKYSKLKNNLATAQSKSSSK
ncbi:glycoside hydrolase family 3 C-terminal domain-containing protein [Amphibacillus sp. MSJ-3]|uniref:glycoside hydrolase family 3 N-terminal domain-containing protein n=1 Tax=Amphibacillus sp. MSJ-3 TaxID=2841505 RepID=UPI001C0EB7D6|nr:glycoside hydrolase family 3 N-terminal domain-containing protein [Amphibacillus sp. MSJ-3]MBU5593731.1 glycoside hydrolase family 3 C-terminal domain-containing protein [Amphibacillus sp. MSJ-3]